MFVTQINIRLRRASVYVFEESPKKGFFVDCFSAARSRVIFFELKQVGHKNGAIKKSLIFFFLKTYI